jgi:hypothetical protein
LPINTTPNEALARLTVHPISREDARRIVVSVHYMRTYPQGAKLNFGVYDGGSVVGVCVMGYSTATVKKVGRLVPDLARSQYCEMQRLWVSDQYGHNTESFVLALIMRRLRRDTDLRVIVTHAGGCKNDCGIVYQTSGWLATKGKTRQQMGEALFGPGEIVDSWRYLYVYPLHKGIRRRLTRQQQPFPKESARYRYNQEWIEGRA